MMGFIYTVVGFFVGILFRILWWDCDLKEYWYFLIGMAVGVLCCYIGYRLYKMPTRKDEEILK